MWTFPSDNLTFSRHKWEERFVFHGRLTGTRVSLVGKTYDIIFYSDIKSAGEKHRKSK